MKKLRFNTTPIVHEWIDDEDRKSNWIHIAADRNRFHRRIRTIESVLNIVLNQNHRNKTDVNRYIEIQSHKM